MDDELKARIEENCKRGEGDCLEWQRYIGRNNLKQMRYKGKWINVNRVYYALHKPIQRGKELLCTCGNPLCINPEHKRQVTKKQKMAELSAKSWEADKPKRVAEMTARERARAKLDLEAARMIRQDRRPNSQIAAEKEISETLVGRIKRNERWKDAGVWAGLM